jgi:hypothetical protein
MEQEHRTDSHYCGEADGPSCQPRLAARHIAGQVIRTWPCLSCLQEPPIFLSPKVP